METRQTLKTCGRTNISALPQFAKLSHSEPTAILAVSTVLPFRVDSYITDELIGWNDIPAHPVYQLTFPQQGVLLPTGIESNAGKLLRPGLG